MSAFRFVDLMDKEPRPPVMVRATLRLLRTDEGGRVSGGILSGYRPNHNFGEPEDREFYIGQIDFDSDHFLELGDSREVLVRFISGPGLRENLQVGRTWRIQEGGKLVGEATVLEVLDET